MQFKKTVLATSLLLAMPSLSHALEEVIVSATKRDTSLQDTSMSISAVTGAQIVRVGAADFADLITTIPSVSLRSAGPGRTKLNIRGISAATGVAPTVSFYLDEMPISTISSGSSTSFQQAIIDPKLFDLNRIEVLRGPQGTLYGSSSMGGTIRLITNQPKVGEEEGSVNFDLSDTEEGGINYVANGMYNIATSDNSALRIVGSYTDRSGYIDRVNLDTDEVYDEDVNTEESTAVRVAYRFEGENMYIQPSVFYQQLEMDGKPNYDGPASEFQQRRLYDAAEPFDDEFTMYNLTYGHSLSAFDILASASYIERETDNTEDITDATIDVFGEAAEAVFADEKVELEDMTFEARATSNGDGAFNWLAGVYYKDSEADAGYRMQRGFDVDISPFGLANTQDLREYEEYAVFTELTMDFGDMFSLTVGGRYLDYEYSQSKEDWGWAFNDGPRATANTLNLSISDDDIHGKVTGAFHYSEDGQLYATVSNGSRPGGGNRSVPRSTDPTKTVGFACDQDLKALGIEGTPDSFTGDEVINYELGFKSDISDTLRLNGAVYLLEWDDIQQVVSTSGDCGVNFTSNIGSAESMGAEMELLAAVTDNLTVAISGGYTDAEFQDTVPSAGVTKGDSLADVPEWTANVNVDWVIPADAGEFFVNANYNYVDETLELSGSAGDDISGNGIISGNTKPDYGITNLRVGFTSVDSWEWLVYVDNLTDEEAIFSYSDTLAFNIGAYDRTVRNRPRTIGTSFTFNF